MINCAQVIEKVLIKETRLYCLYCATLFAIYAHVPPEKAHKIINKIKIIFTFDIMHSLIMKNANSFKFFCCVI